MKEVRNCIKWLALSFVLLSVNALLFSVVPQQFLTESISSIYLIFLSVCLILRNALRVAGQPKQRAAMLNISHMIFLLILLRCVKYSVFGSEFVLGRYTWYLYYVPMLLIPMFLFIFRSMCFPAAKQGKSGSGCGSVY